MQLQKENFMSVCRVHLSRLFFAAIVFLPAVSFGQQFTEQDGFFVRKGYKYTPGKITYERNTVIDPASGDEVVQYGVDSSRPRHINDKRVYGPTEVTTAAGLQPGAFVPEEYLLSQVRDYVGSFYFKEPRLNSVRINLTNVIVDETGKVVFFECCAVKGITADGTVRNMANGELPGRINKIMSELPPMIPATLNGANVMSYADINLHRYKIEGANHQLTYANDGSTDRE